MDPIAESKLSRQRIEKLYKTALYSYSAPFALAGGGLLASFVSDEAERFFFAAAALSLLPLVIVGLVCTIIGLRVAFATSDYQKKDIGYANLIMGLILFALAFLGMGFAYLMTD
ncbi:hypothetical protein [Hymenobacter cellulosilyticus]|uniref:Uncharacterized protein n=1 Tax=Hymenobacter cellulosilyticus TaxID=2932248 RepID=A0A8T9Q4E5_9BACT|nr:hypothetical protein [Hymenobacter cellulosilyticus]UOQ70670.1 hypothetical protein MUN79_18435 [Hymenobacter cellulosilyticus]